MDEIEIRTIAINKTAELLKAKNQKIEDLQSALRACLAVLYEVECACEAQRIGAIEQAHEVL